MLELGSYSKTLHEQVGKEVVNNHIDILFTIGDEAKNIVKQAIQEGMKKDKIQEFENIETAIQFLNQYLTKGDAILIKASNGMNFKKIVEKIK